MVRIATSSMFFHEYTCSEIFDFTESAGCNAIEFWLETPDFWLHGLPVHELTKIIAEHPTLCPVNIHSPVMDLNPCSINPDVADISIMHTVRAVEIAESLNASVITIHPGRRTAKRKVSERDYERFNRYTEAVRKVAMDKTVQVSIENMEKNVNSLLCTPERAREILDREEWLSFTFDTAHALKESINDAIRYIDLCHERIVNVHLSAPGKNRMHLPVSGNRDIGRILECLKSYEYKGCFTLEIEDMNYNHRLNPDEKITIIKKEISYIRKIFD
ncbi:MAG: sugar phosphate isomerase/epimerase [Methanogenium sp.]|nr:sugar phosphate isomerase/epimerase [Methanogenium sp.]